jgi:RNA polymerase sigma-70 factor (ECF subfamily)
VDLRPGKRGWFASTHWSEVLAVSSPNPDRRAAALETLCRKYWSPLYSYIRSRGNDPEGSKDLTQEFFACLLEKRWLQGIENNGSRFRSFLLHALNAFLANQHDRNQAQKRGGGREGFSLDAVQTEADYITELSIQATPAQAYDRRWALTVLQNALGRLEREVLGSGKARQFDVLSPFLSREVEPGEYATVAAQLSISPGAVSVAVHRLRQRYRESVRAEIAETVSDPSHIDEELATLYAALRG